MKVVGYLRVSTDEQKESGAGLEAQRAAIEGMAAVRGWEVKWEVDAGFSAKTLKRPGITRALADLKRGEYAAIVVAKLDRISRSIVDFGSLMERSRREGWGLVALDLGVDTTTPAGELVANVMMAVAQWERRVIGQRTKEALAARRRAGVRLGRPPMIPPEVEERIFALRDADFSMERIAAQLRAEGVPTANGGRWTHSTIRGVLGRRNGPVRR